MKTVSNTLKNALKQPTTQRKGRILVNNEYYEVFNVKYYADAYNEGNVIGNAIASQLDFEMEYIEKFDTFKYFDGVWTGNDYEYVDMGTFHVFDEKDEDDFNKHITAFDNLIKFNIPFNDVGGYPKTLFQELQNVCSQAGVQLLNITIPNGDFIVDNNQFVNGESLKTVLKQICSISGNYAIIKDDMLVLQLKNNTNEIIDKSQHEPVDWKRRTYGINQVIIGVSNVEGEYVIRQDEQDIAQNGVHKLVINDNLFAYTEDKRDALIDALFQQVKGFGYVPYEMTGEWLNYSEIGDTVTIDDVETIVLRIEGSSPKGLESKISAPAVIDSSIEYLDNTNDVKNQLKRTELIVDKQNQEIQALVETVKDIEVDTTLTKQASGNPITIEDAGAYPCESFIVEGKSEQETTNGYQLVDFANPTGHSNYTTSTFENDVITVSSTGGTYQNTNWDITDIVKNNAGKVLNIDYESIDFTNGKNPTAQIIITIDGTKTYNSILSPSLTKQPYTIPLDTTGITEVKFGIWSNNTTTTGEFSVNITKPMLHFGTEELEYEKYTGGVAGPNPDYPSEIETVKGIENLFSYGNSNISGTSKGVTYNYDKDTQIWTLDGTATGQVDIAFTPPKALVLPSDIYRQTQFYLGGSISNGKVTTYSQDRNNDWKGINISLTDNQSHSSLLNYPMEITLNASYIVRVASGTVLSNFQFRTQFTKTSEEYPFIPYGSRYLINKITGKNIANFDTNTTIGNLQATGILDTTNSNYITTEYKKVKPNTKYTLKLKNTYTTSMTNRRCIEYNSLKEFVTVGATISSSAIEYKTITFTTSPTTEYIRLSKRISDEEVQLEKKPSPSEYEPYKENVITYDLKKENHINIDDLKIGFVQNSDTGELIENANFTCTEIMIKVKPNTTYIYIADSSITRIMRTEYDSKKIFNSSLSRVESSNKTTFKTQATTEYIRIAYNSVSTKDFKLYEGTGTDDYYELVSLEDVKDELDETTGVLTKRIGKYTFDGTEAWFKSGNTTSTMFASALDIKEIIKTKRALSSSTHFVANYTPNLTIGTFKLYNYMANGLVQHIALGVDITKIPDLATFKTWLSENPTTLYYVLAEEETIQLKPTEIELFKGTNNIYTLDDLEPNMNITYLTDTKLNAQYATKSELKVAEGNIKSEINATLENEYTTIEQTNAIEQKITDTENSIMLKVNQKANTTDVNNAINELTETTEASLELKLDKTDNNQVVAMINASADEVNIDGKKIALANFQITDDKLMSDITPEHDFTQADVDKVYQYLLGQTTLTPQEIAMYDTSGNGTVDILDLLQIQKVVRSGISSTNPGKFEIDTSPRKTEIIKFYNSEGQLLYYVGYLGSKFNEVSCNSLSTSRLDANNIRSGICVLNSTDVIWVDFGVTFEEVPRVVLTPYTTTTGVIAPKVRSISNTGFEATIGGSGFSNVQCCWIAIS